MFVSYLSTSHLLPFHLQQLTTVTSMADRYVDGQPELPAITAPRFQFAQGFPNGVFDLDVERRVAAERGGDAEVSELAGPHATICWADYKFGVLRRVMNRKETRSKAYVTEIRFGFSPDSAIC